MLIHDEIKMYLNSIDSRFHPSTILIPIENSLTKEMLEENYIKITKIIKHRIRRDRGVIAPTFKGLFFLFLEKKRNGYS